MKICATCKGTFADDVAYCPKDRTYLQKALAPEDPAAKDDDDWFRSKLSAGAQAADFQQHDEAPAIELTPLAPPPPAISLEPVAPVSVKAKNPDLMSALDDHAAPPAAKSPAAAAAAPAKARTPEELAKLLTPTRTSAPPVPKSAANPSAASVAAASPAAPAPLSSHTMRSTSAAPVPWDKIGMGIAGFIVLIGVIFYFQGSSSTSPAGTNEAATSASTPATVSGDDIDVELSLRDKLAQGHDFTGERIEIRVKNGQVVLGGELSSAAKADLAQKMASEVAAGRTVVNKMTVRGAAKYTPAAVKPHTAMTSSLDREDFGDSGVAQQMNANDLVAAGNKALAAGDKKQAAGYFRKALDMNPNDTAATEGYNKATSAP